jgi:hypothetical protein
VGSAQLAQWARPSWPVGPKSWESPCAPAPHSIGPLRPDGVNWVQAQLAARSGFNTPPLSCDAHQVLKEMPGVSRGGDAQRRQRGLRLQWPKVHQIDSPSPRRCTHVQVKRLGPLRPARSTVAHGATARHRVVSLAFGPGATSRWGARASTALARARSRVSARRSSLVPRSATCGGAAGLTFPATERHGATAGTQVQHATAVSTRTWGCPGAQHEAGWRRNHTIPAQFSTARRPIPTMVLAQRRRRSRA